LLTYLPASLASTLISLFAVIFSLVMRGRFDFIPSFQLVNLPLQHILCQRVLIAVFLVCERKNFSLTFPKAYVSLTV